MWSNCQTGPTKHNNKTLESTKYEKQKKVDKKEKSFPVAALSGIVFSPNYNVKVQ